MTEGIQLNGFPSQGTPTDPQDHPADSGHNDNHNPGRAIGSTIGIGDDYTMPRVGPLSDYKVKGKDK